MKDRQTDQLNRGGQRQTHMHSYLINDQCTMQSTVKKGWFIQYMVLRRLDSHTEKIYNFDSYLKINSKWIANLTVKVKTITLLEENYERTFLSFGVSKTFLNRM